MYGIGTGFGFGEKGGSGGGGTTDNSTPPHVVYKSLDGTFRDAPILYTFDVDGFNDLHADVRNFFFSMTDPDDPSSNSGTFKLTPGKIYSEFDVDGNNVEFFNLEKLNGSVDNSFQSRIGSDNIYLSLYGNPQDDFVATLYTEGTLYTQVATPGTIASFQTRMDANTWKIQAANAGDDFGMYVFMAKIDSGAGSTNDFQYQVGSPASPASLFIIVKDTNQNNDFISMGSQDYTATGLNFIRIDQPIGGPGSGFVQIHGDAVYTYSGVQDGSAAGSNIQFEPTDIGFNFANPGDTPSLYMSILKGQDNQYDYQFAVQTPPGLTATLKTRYNANDNDDYALIGNPNEDFTGNKTFIKVILTTPGGEAAKVRINGDIITLEGLQEFADNASAAAALPPNAIYYTTAVVTGNKVLSIV